MNCLFPKIYLFILNKYVITYINIKETISRLRLLSVLKVKIPWKKQRKKGEEKDRKSVCGKNEQ